MLYVIRNLELCLLLEPFRLLNFNIPGRKLFSAQAINVFIFVCIRMHLVVYFLECSLP